MTDWQPQKRSIPSVMTGEVYAAEFVRKGVKSVSGDDLPPGTYLTIRLDDDHPVAAGSVEIRYLPKYRTTVVCPDKLDAPPTPTKDGGRGMKRDQPHSVEIRVLSGPGGGLALYVNDYRVAGPKQINTVQIAQWLVQIKDLRHALERLADAPPPKTEG